jgi:16S rRNA (guanine527-N7)-methyltransferase
MLSPQTVRELLKPFDVQLSGTDLDKIQQYLDLLLRWNRKINLTSVRTPEECLTRHFGESFLLARLFPLVGRLLDIGSGAGFPGLALKLISPNLEVVLLEPVAKKRAFLKEAARICGLDRVRVVGERLEDFSRHEDSRSFDIITARAVGGLEKLVPLAAGLLRPAGRLCLWVGRQQVKKIVQENSGFQWMEPLAIPGSNERVILVGRLAVGETP